MINTQRVKELDVSRAMLYRWYKTPRKERQTALKASTVKGKAEN